MFRLATPISSACPVSDFDDIGTILTHSSLTGSQKAAPWQQHVQKDGQLFYVELTKGARPTKPPRPHKTDSSSVCSLCSTRSCYSGASEDTGYSSDAEGQAVTRNHKLDRLLMDLSLDSLSWTSRHLDLDDVDDGVSVDLSVFEDQVDVRHDVLYDEGELCDLPALWGQGGRATKPSVSSTKPRSSLCQRHSYKLNPAGLSSDALSLQSGGQGSARARHQHAPQKDGLREVVLRLKPGGQAWDGSSTVSWLEAVLGIVPGHLDHSHAGHLNYGHAGLASGEREEGRTAAVMVKGLAPDGPASKCRDIAIGDRIVSINGRQVTWGNLDIVLSSLHHTRKVRLTVSSHGDAPQGFPSPSLPTSLISDRLLLNSGEVLKVLADTTPTRIPLSSPQGRRRGLLETTPTSISNGGWGRGLSETTPTSASTHGGGRRGLLDGVCVMYMSMVGGSESGSQGERADEDVLYQFPDNAGVLASLRGGFFTLDHLLTTDSGHADYTMVTVEVEGSQIRAACRKEGQDLLFVTAPADRLQSSQLEGVTSAVVRLARLLYGSVEEAFRCEHNHSSLDHFLAHLFTAPPSPVRGSHAGPLAPLPGFMSHLPLPDEVVVSINNTLTEYESADYVGLSDTVYNNRRAFTILGSAMFYQGQMTCSHLNPEDVADVGVYLQHSGLLQLSEGEGVNQLLVWREVWPTRLCHEVAAINNVFGYSEPHARWFLMVVGGKNTLLACILEAGGYSTQVGGVCEPDPFYVDQARATLVRLQASDITSACESRLNGNGLPATTTADRLVGQSVTSDSRQHGTDTLGRTNSSAGHPHGVVPALPATGCDSRGGAGEWRKMSIDSGSSGFSSSSDGTQRSGKKGHLLHGAGLPGLGNSGVHTYRLDRGKDCALLAFCQVNQQDGVVVTTPGQDGESGASPSELHQQVMDNFRRCVVQIHEDFSKSANTKVFPSEGLLEDFRGDTTMATCREEGVMFTCTVGDATDRKKPAQSLVYWVVGRKLRGIHSRESYVCFPDSTPQNVIELAFRLNTGTLS